MREHLLRLVFLVAAVSPGFAGIMTLASVGTASNPNQTNSTGGPTVVIQKHPAWVDPLPGSSWVSYTTSGDPTQPDFVVVPNDTVVSFFDAFTLPEPGIGFVKVYADDSTAVYLNGVLLMAEASIPGNTYSRCSDFPVGCQTSTAATVSLTPALQAGLNTLEFRVSQRNLVSFGLDYSGQVITMPEPSTFGFVGVALAGLAIRASRARRKRS